MSATDRSRLMALALLLPIALTACDEDRSADRGGPIDLPGVSSAIVGTTLVEQDTPGDVVSVDLDQDVTVAQLTAILEEIDRLHPDESSVTFACGPATLDPPADDCDTATQSGEMPQGPKPQGAATFLTAARSFPDATISVRDRTTVDIDLGTPTADEVGAALREVLSNSVLSNIDDLSIGAGGRSPGPAFRVTTQARLSAPMADLWDRLVPTLTASVLDVPTALTLSADPNSQIAVVARIELPGLVLPAALTPEAYGDLVWPLVHQQLQVLGDAPAGTTYAVFNSYRQVESGLPSSRDGFLSVTVGAAGQADQLGRTWNVQAARYLSRLTP